MSEQQAVNTIEKVISSETFEEVKGRRRGGNNNARGGSKNAGGGSGPVYRKKEAVTT
jgi:hypothetical protein